MAAKNKKEMELFYQKALNKILEFKADELSAVEFNQVRRNSEKLDIYRFVRRR